MKELNEFSAKVVATVQKIPKGKVATYSQIAGLAGKSHASRGISWILHSCSKAYKLPWQRVINAQGKISFPKKSSHYRKQKSLLQKEGVRFSEDDRIDFKKFQWKKKPSQKKSTKITPKMFGRS